MSRDYTVGYKRPPAHTQFKKGQSGYTPEHRRRKQKKKRVPDVPAALFAALNTKVTITEGGKRRELSAMEVVFRQLVAKAAAGGVPQLRIMLPLLIKLFDINRASDSRDPEAARQKTEELQRELDALFTKLTGAPEAVSAESQAREPKLQESTKSEESVKSEPEKGSDDA